VLSLILFLLSALYGLQNGYDLHQKHSKELKSIKEKNQETINDVLKWYKSGAKGPEDRPWVDISDPFWAIIFAPNSVCKNPSTLMPLSVGQTEQFGYYKEISNWSTTMDSDLAEEIANPERLTLGSIDFSFVLLYLLPILLIILLFNVGGLENDLNFSRLIVINAPSQKKWLAFRFIFYFVFIYALLILFMLFYCLITDVFNENAARFWQFCLYAFFYCLFWFTLFYLINLKGRTSSNQALVMISTWMLFCILIPGAIHQISSVYYPASYMTEFIDANRDESDRIWEMSTDEQKEQLKKIYPEIVKTKYFQDKEASEEIIQNCSSALINELMKNTVKKINANHAKRNDFITSTHWINPVIFFQNKFNHLAQNDYNSYTEFHKEIQQKIDLKNKELVFDSWNKVKYNKRKYLELIKSLNEE
jgi:ABC-2 type transport system permease protein